MSYYLFSLVVFLFFISWSNARHLSFVEMEETKQRAQVRVVATRKNEEENKAKGKEGASSSTPKDIKKGVPKTKADRKDDRPSKIVTVTLGDRLPKKPSPPKLSHGAGK